MVSTGFHLFQDGLKDFHIQLNFFCFFLAKSSAVNAAVDPRQVAFLDEWDFQPEKEDAPPRREETSVKSVIKSNNYSFVAWPEGYQGWKGGTPCLDPKLKADHV